MVIRVSCVFLAVCVVLGLGSAARGATISIDNDQIIHIDGKPAFPIGFTLAPPPHGKTPEGKGGYEELAANGAVWHRCGPPEGTWDTEAEEQLQHILDRSAEAGILCAVSIPTLQVIKPDDKRTKDELRRIVSKWRNHPGLGYWKTKDEPEWGRIPPENLRAFYDIVHEIDPDHPVWLTQAPRGSIASLRRYNEIADIAAIDIYPIGYPPGMHSHLPNKHISVVGDYARWMNEVTGKTKPLWMVLQICWSGVVKDGKTLRFPTFPEQRYMVYQSIINGARGLNFFGGSIEPGLNSRDRDLGWNWTFYRKVLKPVLDEIAPGSPLHPALIAPDYRVALKIEGASDVEALVRSSGDWIYLLAAKREGKTERVTFRGLPEVDAMCNVLYEEPRKVRILAGTLTDWFGPNEVHVYQIPKNPKSERTRGTQ